MSKSVLRGLRAAALTGTLVLGSPLGPQMALAAENPIKLGVLEDQSGDFAAATIGKVHAIQLAADEINKAGGIMGRPLELVAYDTQSDNTRYQEFMRRVLQRDKVDVVFAGFSSASREAYRPIVDQFNGFAFYNNQYEGGVCDGHMIVTGAVPEQQFSTLIPYMMEKYGKNVYTLAADYNFGQISAEWVRKIVKENGGKMAGEEFIPLGVSQFSQSIQNIQKAKPDFVVTLLVGTAQASYYEQAASANVNLPMASSVNVGQGYEHKRFKPPSLKDMYVTTNYIEEISSPKEQGVLRQVQGEVPERALCQPGGGELLSRRLSLQADGGAREVDQARGHPQGDRARRRLHGRAGGQGLHRPEEPAHVAHDLSRQGRCGSRDLFPESLGRHQAVLAG
ncbi:branched-chain amino acid transport system substrate-binding protein [Bradyrhizobium ottawaense]